MAWTIGPTHLNGVLAGKGRFRRYSTWEASLRIDGVFSTLLAVDRTVHHRTSDGWP